MHSRLVLVINIILGISLLAMTLSCEDKLKCYPREDILLELFESNMVDKLSIVQDSLSKTGENQTEVFQFISAKIKRSVTEKSDENDPWTKFNRIEELLENLNEKEARSIFDDLVQSSDLLNIYPYEYYYYKLNFEKEITNELISFIKSVNVTEICDFEFYRFVRLLTSLAQMGRRNSDYNIANSSVHAALFLMKTRLPMVDLMKTKSELLRIKYSNLLEESMEFENSFQKILVVLKELNLKIDQADENILLDQIAETRKFINGLPFNYSFFSIDDIEKLKLSSYDKMILSTELGFNNLFNDPKESIRYYYYSLQFLEQPNCPRYLSFVYNFLLIAYIKEGDILNAEKYYKRSKNFYGCSEFKKSHRVFLNQTYQARYRNKLEKSFTSDQEVKAYLDQRNAADIVFKGQSDHLEDFYVLNAFNILELKKGEELTEEYEVNQIISLIDNTKKRELKRKRRNIRSKEEKEEDSLYNKYLNEVNYYKNTENFKEDAYWKLFLMELEKIKKPQEVEEQKDEAYNYAKVMRVNDESLNIVEYLFKDGEYGGYLFDKDDLKVFDLNSENISKFIEQFEKNIESNLPIDNIISNLRKELLPSNLSDELPLVFLADGPLHKLPFHLIFPNTRSINIGIQEVLDQKPIYLNKNEAAFMGFSDKKTIASKKVRIFPELEASLEEVMEIGKLMGNETEIAMGEKMYRSKLEYYMKKDILHISAHLFADLDKRHGNFLVLRKENAQIDSVFSYEVEAYGIAPKVVVLSTCDSGLGSFTAGLGTFSMSRAFMQNGTQTIIKTLWKVKDTSTKDFMVDLYTNWNTGISLGDALERTRNKFEADPNYTLKDWAGFVLEGNPNVYLN